MLTDDEKRFLDYWEKNRDRQARPKYQLLAGLPLGSLFAFPILLNFILGRFWYKRADAIGASQFNPMVLVVAVLIISVFIGFFYKKFRWDQNEQKFKELKYKERTEAKKDSQMPI
jgi:surface polysaccharide O-acyltransferase-like enzyme